MGNVFSVDTEKIGQHSPSVLRFAADLSSVGESLHAALGELGKCWGDDSAGKQFEAMYAESAETLKGLFSSTAGVITSTAGGIKDMARGLEDLELTNQSAASQLEKHPAGGSSGHGGTKK